MRNIQVIDGADNTGYPIFQAADEAFAVIFPERGQDIEFVNDFVQRVGEENAQSILSALWRTPVKKPDAAGIHGTLFYELDWKRCYYPNKKEADLRDPLIQAQAMKACDKGLKHGSAV